MYARAHLAQQALDGFVGDRTAQPLLQIPGGVNETPEGRRVLARHSVRNIPRHLVLFGERAHDSAVAIQVSADYLLQNVLSQAGQARIVEQRGSPVLFRIEYVTRHVVYARVGEHTARRAGNLRPADAAADLILPATA